MKLNKRGQGTAPIPKHMIYWVLIAALIIVIWFIVKGIINKLLILY